MARAREHGHEEVGEGGIDVHEGLTDVEEDGAEPHAPRIGLSGHVADPSVVPWVVELTRARVVLGHGLGDRLRHGGHPASHRHDAGVLAGSVEGRRHLVR